ncbi:hypothetical protein BKA70DRAFT_1401004 [Coprinopsis sp. MPI-PUGE-AT-0042]|nr:hypothetical protein BKA70DRAFT_1401004 [Coprinopsis sp. MPI-PUGE-AT-0042]
MGLATSLPAVPTVTLQNGIATVGADQNAIYFRYMPGVHRPFPSTGASYDEMVAYFLSYENVTFDFNELVGNQDGHFQLGRWPQVPAQRRSKEFLCQRKPSSRRTAQRGCVDLNLRFGIGDGGELLALESTEKNARIIAVGTQIPHPDWLTSTSTTNDPGKYEQPYIIYHEVSLAKISKAASTDQTPTREKPRMCSKSPVPDSLPSVSSTPYKTARALYMAY